MTEPTWLTEARRHVGLKEVKGPKHNATILAWLDRLRAWWKEDETPWCGTFVAHCVSHAGHPLPKFWMRARDWLNWGTPLTAPTVGAVVVFNRQGGGHVGFVVGQTESGHLLVLGGNQGDAVSIAPFERSRVLGYRWPATAVRPALATLPKLAHAGAVSRNEA